MTTQEVMASQVCKWGCGHSFASYWLWLYHERKECKARPKTAIAMRAWFVDKYPKALEDYTYWTENHIHTRPVALSLAVLDIRIGIEWLEGRTKGTGLTPFSVRLTNGKIFCRPSRIPRYADRLLERQ